jgi:L-asparaginase
MQKLPNIIILATGGTIAGVASSNMATTNYTSASLLIETLIDAVPEMKEIANITGEQVLQVGSHNVNNDMLLQLGKHINEILAIDNIEGVVLTHGTDTLEETAYFLNLVVKSDKPVVVVGSMRPATAISADGPINLFNAVKIASTPEAKGKGVLISFNDRIGSARHISKTNTTMLDTFKSVEDGFTGAVAGGKVYFYNQTTRKHTIQSEFDSYNIDKLPQVDIVYGHQNDGRVIYDALVKAGTKGIVHAGTGNGWLSDLAAAGAYDALKSGVTVVRSSRVGSGIVTPDRSFDPKLIAADSLNPQKARILLMLALTQTNDPDKIQEYFNEY